jgi:hypothetical protein
MGSTHSNSRDHQIKASDLRKMREEAEKLFALDSHGVGKIHKHSTGKGNNQSSTNRWNILRILESIKKDSSIGDSIPGCTANSTCTNSPTITSPRQKGRIYEDSIKNLPNERKQDLQYLQPNHGLRINERQASSSLTSSKELYMALPVDSATHRTLQNNELFTCPAVSPTNSRKARSIRIPVNGRRVGPTNDWLNGDPDMYDDNGDDKYLKQIYDLRTWEMYIRITEARKKKKSWAVSISDHTGTRCIPFKSNTTAATSITNNPPHPLTQPGRFFISCNNVMIPYHNNQVQYVTESPSHYDSDHEMIFGDLDE